MLANPITHRTRPTRSLLVLAATTTPLLAQGGQSGIPPQTLAYTPTNSIEWPVTGFGSPDHFERVACGRFDNGSLLSGPGAAVLLDDPVNGSNLVYFPIPYALDEPEGITWATSSVSDIATLIDGTGPGHDSLLVSDAAGIHVAEHDGMTGFGAKTLSSSASWQSVSMLQCDDLDGAGGHEVVALAFDGITVLILGDVQTPSPTTTSILMSSPVFDVTTLEWTSAIAGREIAVLTSDGVRIYSASGSFLRFFAHAASGGQIEGVGTAGSVDLLAWARPDTSGTTHEIAVVRQLNVLAGQPTTFDFQGSPTNVEALTLTSGDYDNDGADDVLLTHDLGNFGVVLLNQGAHPFFTAATPLGYDSIPYDFLFGAGTGNTATPALSDINGDGRVDLVHAITSEGHMDVWLSAAEQRHPTAMLQPVPSSDDIVKINTFFSDNGAGTSQPPLPRSTLAFAFDSPAQYGSSYDHLQVVVFRQDDPAANYVSHAAEYNRVYRMANLSESQGIYLDDLEPGNHWPLKTHYYMLYRFVTLVEGTTAVPSPGPVNVDAGSQWFVGGWTLRNDPADTAPHASLASYYMLSNGGISGTEFGLLPDAGWPDNSNGGGSIGAYVPMTRVPPFGPGTTPVVQLPTVTGLAENY